MTANHDLPGRVARYYETEPPLRAPDWVLQSALSTIETTPQRRGLPALRRYPTLSTYTKLAAAAVVVLAVGGFALWQFGPGGPGGPPDPTPAPSAAPTPTAAPTLAPTQATYVPPALSQTFTSDLHGLSLSYPEGWTAQAAAEPWTDPFAPQFGDPSGDLFYDPERDAGHLFLAVGSRPLGDTPLDEFLRGFLQAEGCLSGWILTEGPIVIDGADEAIDTSCDLVLASGDGRGYVFKLYTSGDDLDLRSFDSAAFLEDILATVELHPEDALDTAPAN